MQEKLTTAEAIAKAASAYKKVAEDGDTFIPVEFSEENVRMQMADALGVGVEDVEVKDDETGLALFGATRVYAVEAGGVDYSVVESEDEAETLALAVVKQDLEDEPELFDQEWLVSQIDLEKAKSFFTEIYDEHSEAYARDIATEEDSQENKYPNRLVQEMVERNIISEDEGLATNFDTEDKMQDFIDNHTQEAIDEGRGGYDYYAFNFGEEEAKNLVLEHNLIDIDEAARSAVNMDGWAHFISKYDGNYDTTPEGFVYWKE